MADITTNKMGFYKDGNWYIMNNNIFYIPYSFLNLTSGSSSDYISAIGGERRRIDIAMMFAQRDVSLNVGGFSSNLLVLDEVLDNIDDVGTTIILDIIKDLANNSSIYIISHNNYNIDYDNVITICKTSDRLSEILDV
jgi:ABC-type lipopolysaccharide export system ATPase subunit